ncbi:hypothetical protein [Leyella stercorea]|uniref:hypothetical protein n=1 Tax=Leyella stercorea TaxID=363265 RepID=UPI001A3AD4FC|nr:hypothetical protein [Leyella stercorea]MBL6517377.1 hypothetical protein [Leyella stercorea]
MKYESPDTAKSEITPDFSCSYSCQSSHISPRHGFVPKGLSKHTYNVIAKLSRWGSCDLKIGDMTKEELFKLSKEISDLNLGTINFPATMADDTAGITVYPIVDAEDYMYEFILFKYSIQYQASELCEDILNMSKEGYKLTRFGYIPDSKCYVARFSKYNTD